jgi:hypothetical protein
MPQKSLTRHHRMMYSLARHSLRALAGFLFLHPISFLLLFPAIMLDVPIYRVTDYANT